MAFVKQGIKRSIAADRRENERGCSDLVGQLADPDPTARRWAARDLADCPGTSGTLLERLKLEANASVREVILTTLTQLGDEVAVAGLVDCLRSEDATLRNEAISAMQELPDAVAPIMGGLLNDGDADVRIFAVNILQSLRHARVEGWLIEVIDRDPHVNVCGAAVDLLGEVGTEHAREALERLKRRFPDQPYILFAADLALKRIAEDCAAWPN
jgi:HEAT repeat protein